MSDPRPATVASLKTLGGRTTALVCGVLLVGFGLTAWAAVRTKSPTCDEPLHSMGAYMLSHYGDYRINPEDPPLWQWWIALASSRNQLHVDLANALFRAIPQESPNRWPWVFYTLYRMPSNDPDALIGPFRVMLIVLGMMLGAVIGWWSWRLSGGIAAITAAGLFALDPNFLAHTAVVKNDVAISLVGTSLALATWRAGQKLTWANGGAMVLLGAAALVTKFSGPLLLIALAAMLAARIALSTPWRCGAQIIRARRGRAAVAAGLLLLTGVLGYIGIWACYRFNYAISPDGTLWDREPVLKALATSEAVASHRIRPASLDQDLADPREVADRLAHPAVLVRTLVYCDDHRLLPQSWTYGMLYVYQSSRIRDSYLLGHKSIVGFASYFPLAFLFKTPLATLAMLIGASVIGVGAVVTGSRQRRRQSDGDVTTESGGPPIIWSVACLALPFLIVGYADLRSNLNIGLRHILPLYPFLYVAAGCAAARAWRLWGWRIRLIFAGAAVALLAETATSFPDYIAFFNTAAGGERGGYRLLGDSNLDWGQDLPLLAKWQRDHPEVKLYLHYFGTADPGHYGIRYQVMPGVRFPLDAPRVEHIPPEAGVIAISATYLQGLYLWKELDDAYADLHANDTPIDVLGGSIYLYKYAP